VKRIILSFALTTTSLLALEEEPWFGDMCQLQAKASYAYSFFRKVNHGIPQLKKTWHDHLLTLGLEARFPERWSWEIQLEGDATTRRSFGYSSVAAQGRYLWLDDIAGDPVSLVTGLTLREVSTRSLKQLSTPYHGRFSAEGHLAIGKEWTKDCLWHTGLFAFGSIGVPNQGALFGRANLFYLGNYCDKIQWRLFALGYFGAGHRREVPTRHFHGYSKIAHRSIDGGAGVSAALGCGGEYGFLYFDYLYRFYARSYPEKVNCFIFSYELPFSFL
jgi:hypothetical protein